MPDLTVAELARRKGVARSTMSRALAGGRAGSPPKAAPGPVNPGEPQLRYPSDEVDVWWDKRRRPGRPQPAGDAETTGAAGPAAGTESAHAGRGRTG